MNANNIITEIEAAMGQTMAKISQAANKQDLGALERLTKRAAEFKQMKEQVVAIQQRLRTMIESGENGPAAERPSAPTRREARTEVTQGMINQGLLTLTNALRRGTIKAGEEMIVEAAPSGRKFKTVVMASGNKLQERGEVRKFYESAGIMAGDYVLLAELAPGQWKLQKADGSGIQW